jgi:hypothetical protein
MNRACIMLLVSTLGACSADAPGGTGGGGGSTGGAGGDGGDDAPAVGPGPMAVSSGATSTITSASSGSSSSASASSSTGGGCTRDAEEGGMPTTMSEAWLAYCDDVASLETCVGCTPEDCVGHLELLLATEVPECAELEIAWYRCAAALTRSTLVEDCWCEGGGGGLECDLEPTPCAEEKEAFFVCHDAAQP